MSTVVKLRTTDGNGLHAALAAQGLKAQEVETKGVSELQMLLVAVGGGTGLAAVIAAVGQAIKSYLEGVAEVDKHRSIEVSVGNKTIKVTGTTSETILEQLRPLLTT